MSKIITTYFLDDDGVPATGLSPTIRIRDMTTNALVITDAVMSEVGDGGYKYTFVNYDLSTPYQIRCYAGTSITNKYSFAFNEYNYYSGYKVVTAYFMTGEGVPATGLHPTIRIRDLSDNSLVVTDADMEEVGDGGYKYFFLSYDVNKNYQIRCDAGTAVSSRYSYGFNGDYFIDSMNMPFEGEIEDSLDEYGEIENEYELSGTLVVEDD